MLSEQPNSPINRLLADSFEGKEIPTSNSMEFEEMLRFKHVTAEISFNTLHLAVLGGYAQTVEFLYSYLVSYPQYTQDKAKFELGDGPIELNAIHIAILSHLSSITKLILQNDKLSYMHECYLPGSEENGEEHLKLNALQFAVFVDNVDAAKILLQNPYNGG